MDTDPHLVGEGDAVDLTRWATDDDGQLTKKEGKAEFRALNRRLEHLQELLYADGRHAVLAVLQATDTGGKDSTIRRVTNGLNPQGVTVASFKSPSTLERAHDYLWRVHTRAPAAGHITIFNRSHYEDVLVVRVHDLVAPEQWALRYRHIREFERMLADEGTRIVKFFLHLSKDEQRSRLQSRLDDPTKHWKFDPSDLSERDRWDDYQEAFRAMLAETSTGWAPWYVVPADRKWFRDLLVTQVLVDTLSDLDLAYPPAAPGLGAMIIP